MRRKRKDRDIIGNFISKHSHKHPERVGNEGDEDGDENDDNNSAQDFEGLFVANHMSVMLNMSMSLARERNIRDYIR